MKTKGLFKTPGFWISAVGVVAAIAMYIVWCFTGECFRNWGGLTTREFITGFVALALFVGICLQFVPKWMNFWSKDCTLSTAAHKTPKGIMPKLFMLFLLVDVIYLLLVALIQISLGESVSLFFWRCLDSDHYLNIAAEGYLSVGSKSRLVELVFLPGYPLVVALANLLFGNFEVSGLVVSALFFAATGCAFYKLLSLDFEHRDAMRIIKYLLVCPGVFFFVAPMSESMYLLFCVLCFYWIRTGKVTYGCIAGAVASFTRSVGLGLVVPVFFQLVHNCITKDKMLYPIKRRVFDWMSILIIPLGFAVYCGICYHVSGNPLQFMIYQSEHWGQEFGFFFAKVGDQFERVLRCIELRHPNLIGMWIPNFVSCFFGLVMMNFTVKKQHPTYIAWFIVYYAMTIGAKALLSGPRYLMVCFPLTIALALLTKNKYADKIMTVLCVIGALIYTYAFVCRWCVW